MSRPMQRDASVGQPAPLSERAPVAAQRRIDAFFDGEDDVLALDRGEDSCHSPDRYEDSCRSSAESADDCGQGDDDACPYSHGSRGEAPARAA